MKLIFVSTAILHLALADMYLNFPPGGNNRLNEDSREVRNDRRLFDSQNNNRWGYNQQSYAFYEGSQINFRWTIQHGCGADSNVNCDVIIQYACGDEIRDGQTHETIPTNQNQCVNNDCNSDWQYGMHENFEYYQQCHMRERNLRLFPADQLNDLSQETARFTRQNNNGHRFGYSCNEERDYYPYWHPTIWKDIAILTDDDTKCSDLTKQSENVVGRWNCDVPKEILDAYFDIKSKKAIIPNNKEECEVFADRMAAEFPDLTEKVEWKQHKSHGLLEPDCAATKEHRDNHHGNVQDSRFMAGYDWTVPEGINHEQCTFRIRYNMTSSDYDAPNTDIENKIRDDEWCMCRNNYGVDMWSHFGWTGGEAKQRGFRHINDSPIQIFPQINLKLDMAYNTDQLSRVFEDRTHIIKLREVPEDIKKDLADSKKKIRNLNVMGKIGNYVEVYPNVEYDFLPAKLEADQDDYLHVQWSGSNTNNYHNEASQVLPNDQTIEIARRIDRHNIVPIANMSSIFPDSNQVDSIFGFDQATSFKLATGGVYGNDNEYLQTSAPSFDLGLQKLNTADTWYYMSSHNNRFGVRTQKGKLIVNEDINGGSAGGFGGFGRNLPEENNDEEI